MFENRKDAGKRVGEALKKFEAEHPLLLAIPRGGVKVGYYAALELDCDFDIIIVRKIGHPLQPEAAVGAMAEDGSIYMDPWSERNLNRRSLEKIMAAEKKEIQRRIDAYRKGRELADMANRTVVLVDDGIASGATVFAAIAMCRKNEPEKLIVAAPISGRSRLSKLESQTDELIIIEKWENFFAVSQGYHHFSNLSDQQVQYYLDLWQEKVMSKSPLRKKK